LLRALVRLIQISTHAPVAPLNFVEGQTFSSLNVATATAKLYAQDLWVMRVGDKYTLTRANQSPGGGGAFSAASADQNLAAVVLANDDALNVSSRDGIRGVGERPAVVYGRGWPELRSLRRIFALR